MPANAKKPLKPSARELVADGTKAQTRPMATRAERAVAAAPWGEYAGFSQRLLAGVLDWLLCLAGIVVAFILVGSAGNLFYEIGETTSPDAAAETALDLVFLTTLLLAGAVVVAYFTYFWTCKGRTPGMRALDLTLVDTFTGASPRLGRAFARSLLSLVVAAATFVVVGFFGIADEPAAGYSNADFVLAGSALAIVGLAVLGHAWALLDGRKQALQDKLFRLAVVTKRQSLGG